MAAKSNGAAAVHIDNEDTLALIEEGKRLVCEICRYAIFNKRCLYCVVLCCVECCLVVHVCEEKVEEEDVLAKERERARMRAQLMSVAHNHAPLWLHYGWFFICFVDLDVNHRHCLCVHENSGFYGLGWVSGTGGSISIKVTKTDTGGGDEPGVLGSARESEIRSARIVMAPSGVMKERMKPDDIFVLDGFGHVVKEPVTNAKRALAATSSLSLLSNLHSVKPLCCSECAPLFLSAYHMRNAGAIIHSHAVSAVAATLLYHEGDADGAYAVPRGEGGLDEFRITEVEMIKVR